MSGARGTRTCLSVSRAASTQNKGRGGSGRALSVYSTPLKDCLCIPYSVKGVNGPRLINRNCINTHVVYLILSLTIALNQYGHIAIFISYLALRLDEIDI